MIYASAVVLLPVPLLLILCLATDPHVSSINCCCCCSRCVSSGDTLHGGVHQNTVTAASDSISTAASLLSLVRQHPNLSIASTVVRSFTTCINPSVLMQVVMIKDLTKKV